MVINGHWLPGNKTPRMIFNLPLNPASFMFAVHPTPLTYWYYTWELDEEAQQTTVPSLITQSQPGKSLPVTQLASTETGRETYCMVIIPNIVVSECMRAHVSVDLLALQVAPNGGFYHPFFWDPTSLWNTCSKQLQCLNSWQNVISCGM